MRKTLHKDIISQATKLTGYINDAAHGFNPDTIHELRTGFKKLRALFRWQQVSKQRYDRLKKIYALAGEIRNIQVTQEIVKDEPGIPEFNNWLAGKLILLQKDWNLSVKKSTVKKIEQQLKEVNIKFAAHKKFLPKKIKAVQQVAGSTIISDTTIHEVRKKIKDMLYVSDWGKKKKGLSKLTRDIPLAKFKKIGKQIGVYNDKRVVINLFETYTVYKNKAVNQNTILNKWKEEKDSFKLKLIHDIQQCMLSLHRRRYLLKSPLSPGF